MSGSYGRINSLSVSAYNPYMYGYMPLSNKDFCNQNPTIKNIQQPAASLLTNDVISFQGNTQTLNVSTDKIKENYGNNNRISFSEGLGIIVKGGLKKCKEMITSIVQHPLKTIGVVGLTTAGLMALPIIGVPTAVGGAALAIGFAALAGIKGISHTVKFVRNNSNGNFDEARHNLEQIGGDTFDLALSAPFVPKGLKEISKFSKYGKLGYNSELVANMSNAKDIKSAFGELTKANKELSRNINYLDAADKEIAKLTNISEAEKLKIEQYIKDYNVPREKIADVVMEQWSKEHGITVKPDIKYDSLPPSTRGQANPNTCEILVNDHKKHIPQSASKHSEYVLKSRQLKDGIYYDTYENVKTGQVVHESIEKQIVDDNIKLQTNKNALSEEAKEISTLVHERTHVHDFARIAKVEGRNTYLRGTTDSAWQKYLDMARDIPDIAPGSPEAIEVARLNDCTNYYTNAGYLKNQLELNARAAEAELQSRQSFQILDKVFKTAKTPKTAFGTILLSDIRAQSASV